VLECQRKTGKTHLASELAVEQMMKDARWKKKVKNFTPNKEDMERALVESYGKIG
jgi:hypothetical protein